MINLFILFIIGVVVGFFICVAAFALVAKDNKDIYKNAHKNKYYNDK